MMRQLIQADGTVTNIHRKLPMADLKRLIGSGAIDTVTLAHLVHPRHVMLVDDNGHADNKPINQRATELYWANCRPGVTHVIRGDVVVVPDDDFGGPL